MARKVTKETGVYAWTPSQFVEAFNMADDKELGHNYIGMEIVKDRTGEDCVFIKFEYEDIVEGNILTDINQKAKAITKAYAAKQVAKYSKVLSE